VDLEWNLCVSFKFCMKLVLICAGFVKIRTIHVSCPFRTYLLHESSVNLVKISEKMDLKLTMANFLKL
jgi:hypothetical protein